MSFSVSIEKVKTTQNSVEFNKKPHKSHKTTTNMLIYIWKSGILNSENVKNQKIQNGW